MKQYSQKVGRFQRLSTVRFSYLWISFAGLLILLAGCQFNQGPTIPNESAATPISPSLTSLPPTTTVTPTNEPVRIHEMARFGKGSAETAGISLDGKKAAIGGTQGVTIVDLVSQKVVRTIPFDLFDIDHIHFSPDGRFIAFSALMSYLIVDVDSGETLIKYAAPEYSDFTFEFSPDSQTIAAITDNLTVWDIAKKKKLFEVNALMDPPDEERMLVDDDFEKFLAVRFTPDGKYLIGAGKFKQIYFWEMPRGILTDTLKGHTAEILDLAISPDGKLLASAGEDATIRLWNMDTHKLVRVFSDFKTVTSSVTFTSDGEALEIGLQDGSIERRRVTNGELISNLTATPDPAPALLHSMQFKEGFQGDLSALYFAHDGKSLIACDSYSQSIVIWDIQTQTITKILQQPELCLAISNNRQLLAAADTQNDSISIWDTRSWEKVTTLQVSKLLKPYSYYLDDVVFSPDDQLLALDRPYKVEVWDLNTASMVQSFSLKSQYIGKMAFSADGSTLMAAEYEPVIHILEWNLATGSQVAEFSLEKDGGFDPVVGIQGTQAAIFQSMSADSDGFIEIWDIRSGQLIRTLPRLYDYYPEPLLYSQKSRLAVFNNIYYLQFFDLTDGQLIYRYKHSSEFPGNRGLALSPDEQSLAFADANGVIYVWDIHTIVHAIERRPTPLPTVPPAHAPTLIPTATDFPRATPLAWQSEALTDGVILYSPREQDNVIEKIDRESPLPEQFFSQEECCLMLYTGKMTSPDRKYAAIVTGADELLVTDGQTQISANLDKLNAIDIVYWPNNEQVFLWPKDYDSAPFGKLILYSPFTQEAKLIIPSFPDLVNTDLFPVSQWQNAMNDAKYDPSLSFVVYYRAVKGKGDVFNSIVLWDIQNNQELWHRNLAYTTSWPFPSEPEWSPDGKRFAIFLPTVKNLSQLELVIIDSSGNETRIASSKLPQSIRYGAGLEWSPDGNFLAFYVQDNDQLRLLVYDLEKDEIWDPLIIIDYSDALLGEMQGVVWSPDSTQFLTHLTLSLVDIEKKQVFEFPYAFRNAVWLTAKE